MPPLHLTCFVDRVVAVVPSDTYWGVLGILSSMNPLHVETCGVGSGAMSDIFLLTTFINMNDHVMELGAE